jgi:uncharacterized protein
MKPQVTVRIYEELNSYLPTDQQKKDFFVTISPNLLVKELFEKLGIPLSVVDLILVNGKSASQEYPLNNGDRISIYPVFETFNIASILQLREKPLRSLRFICDVHLGKLAKHLRMLGFDVIYQNDFSLGQLVQISVEEQRILLSRSREIFKNKLITRGYLVTSDKIHIQLKEIISYFDLKDFIQPLSRCLKCNMTVHLAEKNTIQPDVPADVFNMYEKFTRCDTCDRIYWMGSHYSSMMYWINQI